MEASSGVDLRRVVIALGLAQIVSWGTLFYSIAVLGPPMAHALGVGDVMLYGSFTGALFVSGLVSPWVGRRIDRRGGRGVLAGGSLLGALACAILALAGNGITMLAGWLLAGVAMGACLYDPAFATLFRVSGASYRRMVTALTLFGGFASTVFWPLTQLLIQRQGWQQALLVLGAVNLVVCAPLHGWVLPMAPARNVPTKAQPPAEPSARMLDATFFGLCAAFTGNALVFSAMSVHLIPLLQGKGLSASQAAWVAAMIGPMQVAGRVIEYTLLSRWSPSRVGTLAMWLLPMALGLLALVAPNLRVMGVFALLYGMGNGVMTIVRGATPAELYGRERYGAINGAMATPVLIAKAAGPIFASLVLSATASPLRLLLCLAAIGAASSVIFSLAVRRRRPAIATNPQQPVHP